MNRIYRTLWSVATQSWQAVPETSKSAGKKSKSSAGGVLASVALGIGLSGGANAQSPPAVNQLPTGGSVARGTATISQTATAQAAAMTVNQASQRAVINWNTFNIGSNASVNFVQPNAQAVTLNRVNDSNPSQIFGRISANGQVFLTNANGVYFSRTSSVDVGAFTATTHSITDDNFMSGKYVFERNGATGKIINEGNITAALGGYVALLAPEVQNAGVVVARAGTVAMAAGETMTLNIDGVGGLAGITTTPSAIASLIENKLAVQAPEGQIILSAVALNKLQAGLIKNSGSLEANSLVNKGGKIYLEGDNITLESNSKIEAKGPLGGGTVLVGGDWQGSGTLRQATKVTMEAGATIDASATDNGDGGKVVLWSDVHNANSVTQVNGSINAKAGLNGGNGGKVETSGHQLKVGSLAQVDTQGGQWLLDPYNFTVALSGGDITGAQLGNALNSSNVTIQTFASGNATASGGGLTTSSSAASGNGDINITDAVTWSSTKVLTLTAVGAINGTGNLAMNSTTAGAGVVFNQGADGAYSGSITGYTANPISGSINVTLTKLGTGTLTLSGANNKYITPIIAEGVLKLGSANALGGSATGSVVTVNSGATLDLNGIVSSLANPRDIWINGVGVGGLGALINSSATGSSLVNSRLHLGSNSLISAIAGNITFSGYSIASSGYDLTLAGTAMGILTNTQINLGAGTLIKKGSGTWDINGGNSTSTGLTNILAGTLTIRANNSLGNGNIAIDGGTLYMYGASQNAGAVTVTNGGSITVYDNGAVRTINASSFVINSDTATVIKPVLADLNGSTHATLTKSGTGTLTLWGNNTYSGSTTINGGTLQIGYASTAGSIASASAISIASGATLAYNLSSGAAPTNAISSTTTGSGTIANAYTTGASATNVILDLSGADLSGFSGTYSTYINEATATPARASIKLGTSPNLTGATFNVVTSGYKPAFANLTGVTWTGAATGTPSLKANGIAMTSGVMGLGVTLTLNASDLTLGQGGAWSLTGNVNGTTGTMYLPESNTAAYTLSGTVTADVLNGLTITQSGALTQSSAGGATNGDLVVNGNGGTLILSANNSYAGTTTINSGTLQVGTDAGNAGTLGAGAVYNNANLNFFRLNGYNLSDLASYAGGITGTGNVKAQSRGFLNIDRDITLSGASSRIDLLAGSNTAVGVITGGDLTLTNTVTTSNTGTFSIFTATPNFYADGTNTLMLKMVGATGALKYKTYNTTKNSMPSAVLGTRNFNYRQAVAVTTSAATLTKSYDGTTTTVGATQTGGAVTGAIDGDSFIASISGGSYASPPNAGTNITITGATASIVATSGTGWSLSGYTTSLGAVSGVINKANLTITPTTGQSKTYGGAEPSLTYTPTGFVNGETSIAGLSGVLTRAAGENVGTYAYSVSGLSSTNYTFTMVGSPSQFTINKANLTVTPTTGLTKIYGALDPTLTYTTSALLNSDASIAGLSGTLTRATGENVGNYAYSVSGLSSTNYTFTMVGSPSEFAISARPITVTANTLNKVYGNSDPTLTYTLTSGSMANSETLSGALSRASGETVGTYAIGQGTLAASSNYTLTYAAANLVIDPRPVTLTGQMNYSGQPTLDTTQTGTTLSATNVVQGDSLTITGTAPLAAAAAGTQAITAFNNLGLSNSNYTTTGASGSVNVIPTGGINVTPLNNNEVAALIGSQLAGLTGSQIAAFSTTQLQVFSWQQIAALSPSQFAALSPAQLASLSAAQLQGLSAAQMSFMTPAQLGGLTPSQFAGLNNAQLQAMSAAQVRAISTAQLSLLSPAQIALLTGNAATPLSLQQIMALTPAQLGGMSTVQVARLTAAEVSSLSDAQLNALSLEQLAAISPASLAALSSEQIMALSLTQVASLTPEQLSSLSPTQIASLSAEEVASFNTQQLAAIGIFPAVITPDEAPVVTAKFEAPIPVMTEVAAPNVPAVEVATPVVTPVTPSVSTVEAAPVAITATDANAHTGVLAITVFSGADARPITTGVAFEQDANSVSLRLTSAPSVPPVSAKLVFNDKLTTFMVAHTNGQMVEFQGGLINKRLIIVAPSSAAKQIARADMNMVLAAAITSLGAENRVVLANLDGVVIDLR